MGRSKKSYDGTLTISRKLVLRLGGLLLLAVAGVMFFAPFLGMWNVVYLRPTSVLAGLGVALLITAEFTED